MSSAELPDSCTRLTIKAPVASAPIDTHVFVCTGKSCTGNGSEAVLEAFWKELAARRLLYGKRGCLDGRVLVTTCGSMGFCAIGPAVLVYPEGVWYAGVTPEDVPEIIDGHLVGGRPVDRLVVRQLATHQT